MIPIIFKMTLSINIRIGLLPAGNEMAVSNYIVKAIGNNS